jgi:hypothetical protein
MQLLCVAHQSHTLTTLRSTYQRTALRKYLQEGWHVVRMKRKTDNAGDHSGSFLIIRI